MIDAHERLFLRYAYELGISSSELGEITQDEAYAFAGRMRMYLPYASHELVGYLAHSITMRAHRGGLGLDWLENLMKEFDMEEFSRSELDTAAKLS